MAKLPDFSDLTKKLDLQGLFDSVKSAVSGSGTPPKAPEGDEVAAKFVEVITLVQNLVTAHAEQAKIIANVHHKLNTLYKDIQAMQQAALPTETSTASETKTAKIADNPPAKQKTKKHIETEEEDQ